MGVDDVSVDVYVSRHHDSLAPWKIEGPRDQGGESDRFCVSCQLVVFPCHATDASARCGLQVCFTYHAACFLCKVFVVVENPYTRDRNLTY